MPRGGVVTQNRRGMDFTRRDVRVRGEHRLGSSEGPGRVPGIERDAGSHDETRQRLD